jgi:hypothetical protein
MSTAATPTCYSCTQFDKPTPVDQLIKCSKCENPDILYCSEKCKKVFSKRLTASGRLGYRGTKRSSDNLLKHQFICGKKSFTADEFFKAYLSLTDAELDSLAQSDEKAKNYQAYRDFSKQMEKWTENDEAPSKKQISLLSQAANRGCPVCKYEMFEADGVFDGVDNSQLP